MGIINIKKFKSFKMIGPIEIHYHLKSPILDLIILKDGNIVTISTHKKVTFYNKEYNFIFEFIVDRQYENGIGDGNLTELGNEDLIITYDYIVEIRKKEKNNYSILQKMNFNGRVCRITTKEFKNNKFLIYRKYFNDIQLWEKNEKNNNYKCIYETNLLSMNINGMLIINKNLFLIQNYEYFYFYSHNFNDKKNILLKKYKSNSNSQMVELYDFYCEISLRFRYFYSLTKYLYNNNIYLVGNNIIYVINSKNFKFEKYYIDLYNINSMLFLSNGNALFATPKAISEYKFENNKFIKIKKSSDKLVINNECKLELLQNKDDIILYSDRILIFKLKDILE